MFRKAFSSVGEFCVQLVTDHDGKASAGRMATLVVIATWCIISIRAHTVSERTDQVALLATALWGSTKFSEAFSKFAQYKQALADAALSSGSAPPGTSVETKTTVS